MTARAALRAPMSLKTGDVDIVQSVDGETHFRVGGKDIDGVKSFTFHWSVHDVPTLTIERYVCEEPADDA